MHRVPQHSRHTTCMDRFLVKRPREDAAAAPAAVAAKAPKPAAGSDVELLLASLADASWRAALDKEFSKSYFAELARQVNLERTKKKIFPPADEVFTTFNLTPLPDVRIVILGQDPCKLLMQCHACTTAPARVLIASRVPPTTPRRRSRSGPGARPLL